MLNEQLLWHDTSPEKAAAVCGQGFDLRVAASIGLCGRGAYFAYGSNLAAAYAQMKHSASKNAEVSVRMQRPLQLDTTLPCLDLLSLQTVCVGV